MTAEEFVRKEFNVSKWDSLDDVLTHDEIIYALVEFAKYHAKEANERAKNYIPDVNEDLEVYPLENIK